MSLFSTIIVLDTQQNPHDHAGAKIISVVVLAFPAGHVNKALRAAREGRQMVDVVKRNNTENHIRLSIIIIRKKYGHATKNS